MREGGGDAGEVVKQRVQLVQAIGRIVDIDRLMVAECEQVVVARLAGRLVAGLRSPVERRSIWL